MTSGIKPTRFDYFLIASIAAYAKYTYGFTEHAKSLTNSTQIAPIHTSEPVPSASAVINNFQPVIVRVDPYTCTL